MGAGSLGIGLIGLGIHGARYARHLADGDIDGGHLAAVWSRGAERARAAANLYAVPALPTVESLCTHPGVAAVAVVIPVGRHVEVLETALAAGRPVLVEKPFAPDRARGEALIEKAQLRALPLTVAHTLRFDPLLEALRTAAADPELGRLRGFEFAQRLEPRDVTWEDDPALAAGGVLMQTGIHGIDALRFALSAELEVTGVSAQQLRYREVEDAITVQLRAHGGRAGPGAEGLLSTSKLGRSRHHRFALFFDEAGLEADFIDRALYVTRGRVRESRPVPAVSTITRTLNAFVDHVRTPGSPNPVPAAEGLAAVSIVEEAYLQLGSEAESRRAT